MRSKYVRQPILENRCADCPHSRLSHLAEGENPNYVGCRFCECKAWRACAEALALLDICADPCRVETCGESCVRPPTHDGDNCECQTHRAEALAPPAPPAQAPTDENK